MRPTRIERSRDTASRGFSLVELLCAVMILGFALVGLTEGITSSIRATKIAEIHTQAALLASGRLEEIRAEGYYTAGENEGECVGDPPGFRYEETIESADLDGLFSATVRVFHSSSEEPVFVLDTLLFDKPYELLAGELSPKDAKERQRRARGLDTGSSGTGASGRSSGDAGRASGARR